MKKRSVFAILALAGITVLGLGACAETDVVATVAVSSFDALGTKLQDKISYVADDQSWRLTSPGGDIFQIALDFSRPNPDGQSPDFELDFDATPFLAAGLDMAKLPMNMDQALSYHLEDGRFMLHFEWGSAPLKTAVDGSAAPSASNPAKEGILATFKQIIASYRERIGYHEKLDHYGFALGDGNMVEWAKDMATNDKDLVFVLNPEPLIQAGLDPAKVEGWVYAKVEIKDANGKTQGVDKLLRPFSL